MRTLSPKADASTSAGNPLVHQSDAYKKDPIQRIFVGRSLRLEKIKFFGFGNSLLGNCRNDLIF